jgi:hypothetical protein
MRLLLLLAALLLPLAARAEANHDAAIDKAIHTILDGDADTTAAALKDLRDLHDTAAVAPLIQMLFWTDDGQPIVDTLGALTGAHPGAKFFDWMVWQQDHPELHPYGGYTALLIELLTGLDRNYDRFLHPGIRTTIRLEEIVWGGVKVDAIPALDNPKMIGAGEASYLNDDDRVFGIDINGDARAYPLRIMNWHEMANDVVGGEPVSLAYCTLCGAGILYDGRVEGAPKAVTFGTSGLLYRSNKLMYDRISESLWDQFTGEPVVGQLVGMHAKLKQLPMVLTTWAAWKARHPDTKVLSLETGFHRNYAPGAAYAKYFASPDLAFPAAVHNHALGAKDRVFGVRVPGGARAWPLARFEGGALIQERVGLQEVVVIGEGSEIRAYDATGHRFSRLGPATLHAEDGDWTIGEDALHGPGGRSLARLPGGVSYWFAWNGFFGDTLAP